jgi:hypothetical protein
VHDVKQLAVSHQAALRTQLRHIHNMLSVINEVQGPIGTLVRVITTLLAINALGIALVLDKFVSRYGTNILEK